jgi:hypothetical protein
MSVDIMYNQEIDGRKKRKRRAITCPSHNPIIVSKNQSAPENKTNNPRKKMSNPLQLLAALAGLGSLLGEKVWKWC